MSEQITQEMIERWEMKLKALEEHPQAMGSEEARIIGGINRTFKRTGYLSWRQSKYLGRVYNKL